MLRRRLGWSLRRIQKETGVRRETAAAYLKAAGIAFRPPGGWGRQPPAKPANEVITDSAASKLVSQAAIDAAPAKPANEVITDFGAELGDGATAASEPQGDRSPSASACAPYVETVELGLSRGRNAMAIWQDLVDTCGFAAGYQSVRRFVSKLHFNQSQEACVVIETAPGEDYGESRIMVRSGAVPAFLAGFSAASVT
jgi:transposase